MIFQNWYGTAVPEQLVLLPKLLFLNDCLLPDVDDF